MDIPTPEALRKQSALLAERYPSPDKDEALEILAAVTGPLVGSITGRIIGGGEGEDVPEFMVALATRAVAVKCEQFDSALGTVKARRQSLNRGNIASFAAGSYSESYFGPQQMVIAKRLDPDPIVSELLWALATEQRRYEWLELWDPANFAGAHLSGFIESFEYGNRPNYSTGRYGWLYQPYFEGP